MPHKKATKPLRPSVPTSILIFRYWVNSDRNVICNINEVDHLMFTSTEKNPKLKTLFERHQLVLEIFELRLKEFAEKHFVHDKHFGFLTTCPGLFAYGYVCGCRHVTRGTHSLHHVKGPGLPGGPGRGPKRAQAGANCGPG